MTNNFRKIVFFLARSSVSLTLTALLALTAVLALPASAQLAGSSSVTSSLPPPPAWAIASRLAKARDYNGAIKKLNDITSSATYKSTPYAPEAVYSIAHIYEDNLHDDNSAMSSLNTLVNNYANVSYPQQPTVIAERDALGRKIDAENRAAALKGPTNWGSLPALWEALLATGYVVVDFFVRLTGSQNYSYWVALLLISVIVRLALWPLSIKQYKSMKEMQRVQPLIKELQAKYKNDKVTLQTKTMELYKEHQINPAAGCLPMVMQFPVFIYMYHAVWLYQYRFSHGTFLWITPSVHSLAPHWFGANLADQDIVLLALYSISMYVTQRMMPVSDPQQAEMQKSTAGMSSVIFFVLFQNYHFPSAFVLYWLFSNVVSTLVQITVMRQSGYMQSPAATPVPPSDGDINQTVVMNGVDGSHSGNGAAPKVAPNIAGNGVNGAAKGMIAPKIHPKKKRR